MSQESNVEDCTRKCVEILGGNYYVIVGDFVQVNVPFENRIEMEKPRAIAEGIAQTVFEMMRDKYENVITEMKQNSSTENI